MPYDPKRHDRRSIRLPDYDYRQPGGYFVTICAQNRVCLFGEIIERRMRLNAAGQMIHAVWSTLPRRFPQMETDAFVIMPNHVHGIIVLTDDPNVGASLVDAQEDGAPTRAAPTGSSASLGDIVGAFKSMTTVRYIDGVKNDGWPVFDKRVWQRNYYEHIIRNRKDLERIRRYIQENPARWDRDRYHIAP